MRIIHDIEFTSEEKDYYKSIIYENCYPCIQSILIGGKNLGISVESEKKKKIPCRIYFQRKL